VDTVRNRPQPTSRRTAVTVALTTAAALAAGAVGVSPATAGTSSSARWRTLAARVRTGGPAAVRFRAATLPVTVPADVSAYLHGDRTDLQWPLRALHVPQAWSASRGAGVVVATVDTGVDVTAPDLAGALVPGAHLTAGGVLVAGTSADRLGHGTHVAGIIAARDDGHGISGVAPDAEVMPIDVDSADGPLTGAQVGAAIAWAAAHGARVVNLSLGFADVPTSTADVRAMCTAVAAAVARGVVVVASAGNDGDGANDAKAPADCPGAISVAAVDGDLHPTPWSSYDGTVTVAAPGADVWSTVPAAASPLRYAAESGTSMAAPFVAGVAALLLARNPDWTPAQVTARLTATALDVAPAGRDPRTGAGVVDPAAALGAAAPAPEPVPVVEVAADPYASRTDKDGFSVYDQVAVHWVPDPTVPVTGYRITRWTAAGTATTTVGADAVRAVFPVGQATYQVTALTPAGDVPSAPVWFPLAGQDFTPITPVTGLRATWTRTGGITLRWAVPARDRGVADQYAVLVNGDAVAGADGVTIPTSVSVPARLVPPGDLVISVILGGTSTQDVEETRTALAARVPFSGTAVAAGRGHYRVDVAVAPSRRRLCGGSRCTGAQVTVSVGRTAYGTRLDRTGHAVVLVAASSSRGKVTVGVTMSGRAGLTDRALPLPLR